MADNGGSPDWGVVGGAVAAVVTAVGGAIAIVLRKPPANGSAHSSDPTVKTLDSVFKLVEQLQEENARKTSALERIEVRITSLLETIAELRQTIAELRQTASELRQTINDLERQIRLLRTRPSSHMPPELT
jgi:septal ring factor EnvC (AmiA/AmiB activator)